VVFSSTGQPEKKETPPKKKEIVPARKKPARTTVLAPYRPWDIWTDFDNLFDNFRSSFEEFLLPLATPFSQGKITTRAEIKPSEVALLIDDFDQLPEVAEWQKYMYAKNLSEKTIKGRGNNWNNGHAQAPRRGHHKGTEEDWARGDHADGRQREGRQGGLEDPRHREVHCWRSTEREG
jgi:hypothetical protein